MRAPQAILERMKIGLFNYKKTKTVIEQLNSRTPFDLLENHWLP